MAKNKAVKLFGFYLLIKNLLLSTFLGLQQVMFIFLERNFG